MLGWTGSRVLQGPAWGHRVWFGNWMGQDPVCSRRSVGDYFGTGVGQETGAMEPAWCKSGSALGFMVNLGTHFILPPPRGGSFFSLTCPGLGKYDRGNVQLFPCPLWWVFCCSCSSPRCCKPSPGILNSCFVLFCFAWIIAEVDTSGRGWVLAIPISLSYWCYPKAVLRVNL